MPPARTRLVEQWKQIYLIGLRNGRTETIAAKSAMVGRDRIIQAMHRDPKFAEDARAATEFGRKRQVHY